MKRSRRERPSKLQYRRYLTRLGPLYETHAALIVEEERERTVLAGAQHLVCPVLVLTFSLDYSWGRSATAKPAF